MVAIAPVPELIIGMAVGAVALESSSWLLDLRNKSYSNRKDQVESPQIAHNPPTLNQKKKSKTTYHTLKRKMISATQGLKGCWGGGLHLTHKSGSCKNKMGHSR